MRISFHKVMILLLAAEGVRRGKERAAGAESSKVHLSKT